MNRIRRNTIGMFDCLKGLAMLGVIFFHSYMDVWAAGQYEFTTIGYKLISTMPAPAIGILFLISGYGFSPIRKKKSFVTQVKLLLKPCVIVLFCAILVRIPLNLAMGQPPFAGAWLRILGFLLGSLSYTSIFQIPVYSILVFWYLIALFLAWLLLSLIFHLFSKTGARTAAVGVCVLAGAILSLLKIKVPFCIIPTLLAIGFLYLGYMIKKNKWLFVKLPWWLYLVMAAFSLVILKCGEMNIGTGVMKLWLLDYAGMLCTCYLGLRLYLFLYCPDWKIYTPFAYLGRNSLLILCLHGFEHLVFEWKTYEILTKYAPDLTACALGLVRTAIILCCFFVVLFLQRCIKKGKLARADKKAGQA